MKFTSYEVHPVREVGEKIQTCDATPEKANFWSVYGRFTPSHGGSAVAMCIGDFSTREAAELVMSYIRGQSAP